MAMENHKDLLFIMNIVFDGSRDRRIDKTVMFLFGVWGGGGWAD